MSEGKWDGMMTQKHIGYRSWNDNFRADIMPKVINLKPTPNPSRGKGSLVSELGFAFTHSNGYIAMEAEHFFSATSGEKTSWTVYPYYGRTRSAVALTPYTEAVDGAKLTYQFTMPNDVKTVKVHVVVKSTLDFLNVGGHEYGVSLDGDEPQIVNFNKTLVDRQPYMYSDFYPTIARRVVEKTVELPVHSSNDVHQLTLTPRHPGIVFEKIVVDFGGYKPSYLFMNESPYTNNRK
jgi:hypothetical protein